MEVNQLTLFVEHSYFTENLEAQQQLQGIRESLVKAGYTVQDVAYLSWDICQHGQTVARLVYNGFGTGIGRWWVVGSGCPGGVIKVIERVARRKFKKK